MLSENELRWQRVDEIFHKVVDLDPGEQEKHLLEECADDGELTLALRRLLQGDVAADSFLTPVNVEIPSTRLEPGAQLGDYVIEELIGEGGASVVYRARLTDDTVDRKVAIKVLREALPSAEAIERFKRECLLLGRLEHPNIARLYHVGGVDGLPFLIMELIDGVDIATYCNDKRLSVRERVELMMQVCHAVEHAHAQLIVHRDIKPSNVMVDSAGVPKLLDFGIAKPLDTAALLTRSLTQIGEPMTPQYASPEQVQGGEIATATDVYSLGVLLYELLSGVSPHGETGENLLQLVRAIAESPVEPMSVAFGRGEAATIDGLAQERSASVTELRRALRGDLDAIVGKTLEKSPQKRVGSSRELAEELDRHLRHLPIQSRKTTRLSQAVRSFRRHPVRAGLVAVAAALSIGWVVSEQDHLREVSEERDHAEAVVDFLQRMFDAQGPNATVSEATSLGSILSSAVENITGDFEDNLRLRAAAMNSLGRLHQSLGLRSEALELYEQALEINQEVLPPAHREVGAGYFRLAGQKSMAYKMDEAIQLYEKSLETEYAEEEDQRPMIQFGMAIAMTRSGRLDEAEQASLGALEGIGWPEERDEAGTDGLLVLLGEIASLQGNYDEAISRTEEGIALSVENGAERRETIDNRAALADFKRRGGRYVDAIAEFREVIADNREAKGPGDVREGNYLGSLGRSLSEVGRYPEAIDALTQAGEVLLRHYPPQNSRFMIGRIQLVRAYLLAGRHQDAQGTLEGLREVVTAMEPVNPVVGALLDTLEGRILIADDKPNRGKEMIRSAIDIAVEQELPVDVNGPRRWLALAELETGDFDEAVAVLVKPLAELQREAPREATTEVDLARILVDAYVGLGQMNLSESVRKSVLDRYAETDFKHEILADRLGTLRQRAEERVLEKGAEDAE